ncbi:MAG: hypothetical protein N4A72_17460 [Bacteroidales bacterium]|jgi:Ca2+/Na+ antiporter|nr:hypothetical protein [Bacteroidales bacterium]
MSKINFLDIDEQINQNTKLLDFYYNNYQRTQSKVSTLVIIYSILAVYTFQVIKYPIINWDNKSIIILIIYIILVLCYIIFLSFSVKNTYQLLKPIEIAFLNEPKKFYKSLKEEYEKSLKTEDNEIINDYIKASYLGEIEEAVQYNSRKFEEKGSYYNKAFNNALLAIAFYFMCTGFIVFKTDQSKKIEITNYKNIVNSIDSIVNKQIYFKMAEKDKSPKKIDQKKVIVSKPKYIKESFSKVKKNAKE